MLATDFQTNAFDKQQNPSAQVFDLVSDTLKNHLIKPHLIIERINYLDNELRKRPSKRLFEDISSARQILVNQKRMAKQAQIYTKAIEGLSSKEQFQKLDFDCIRDQIKSTATRVQVTKHHAYLPQVVEQKKKLNRNRAHGAHGGLAYGNELNQKEIACRMVILSEILSEEEREAFKEEILAEIKRIPYDLLDVRTYDMMRHYITSCMIVSRMFELAIFNTKSLLFREKHDSIYRKMRQEIAAFFIKESEPSLKVQAENSHVDSLPKVKRLEAKTNKKCLIYAQQTTQQEDLIQQIEETFQSAKQSLKSAFLEMNRPDYAYMTESSINFRAPVQSALTTPSRRELR